MEDAQEVTRLREVVRGSTVEQVANSLRSLIHRGELSPGDRLPAERQLAQRLGIGRITLRGALAILQDEGYLTPKLGARGGSFVTELEEPYTRWLERMRADLDGLQDLLQFRIAVERRAAELAAEQADGSDMKAMSSALEMLRNARSRREYRQADSDFHTAIGRASKSARLGRSVEDARGEFFAPVDQLMFEEQIQNTLEQHTEIFEAISRHASNEAGRAVVRHIENTWRDMSNLLRVRRIKAPS